MTLNQEIINGKWLEIKGDLKSIAGLVLQKHGEEFEKVQAKYVEIIDALSTKKEAVLANIKQELKS